MDWVGGAGWGEFGGDPVTGARFTQHTWEADGLTIKAHGKGIIASCPTPQAGGTFECSANARLIAAAPELYEAAMTALGLIEPLTGQGEDAIWRPANKAWETLVAATRKARGEAS